MNSLILMGFGLQIFLIFLNSIVHSQDMVRVFLTNSTVNFSEEFNSFLSVYQFLMIFTAITGNSIVVYASRKYNALHIDSSSVLLIQNLAVADILLAVLAYVPKLVTLLHGHWALGHVVCYVTAFSQFVPGAVEILTLTCITLYRWYVVRFPYGNLPNMFQTKLLIGSIWLLALINPIFFVSANKSMAIFDVRTLGCVTNVGKHHLKLVIAFSFFFGILPVITTILFNLLTLARAFWITSSQTPPKKVHNKQALVTVSAICWVFVLSWMPYLVRIMTMLLSSKGLPPWFYTLQYNLNILSLTLNPIIYTLTNRKFRKFLNRRGMRFKKRLKTMKTSLHMSLERKLSRNSVSVGVKHNDFNDGPKISSDKSLECNNCESLEDIQITVESVVQHVQPDNLISSEQPDFEKSKMSTMSQSKQHSSYTKPLCLYDQYMNR